MALWLGLSRAESCKLYKPDHASLYRIGDNRNHFFNFIDNEAVNAQRNPLTSIRSSLASYQFVLYR